MLARKTLGTSLLLGPATAVAVAAQAMQMMVSIAAAAATLLANRLQPVAWVLLPAVMQEAWQLWQQEHQAQSRLAGQRLPAIASLPSVCLNLRSAERRSSPPAGRALLHVCCAPTSHQPEGSQGWQAPKWAPLLKSWVRRLALRTHALLWKARCQRRQEQPPVHPLAATELLTAGHLVCSGAGGLQALLVHERTTELAPLATPAQGTPG